MVQASRRAQVRGPTFIRLLARLTEVDVPQPRQLLSDRLSQWLDWSHALVLSSALDGDPSALDADAPMFGSAEEREYARVRATLAKAIADGLDPDEAPMAKGASLEPIDYTRFRRHHVATQRAMLAATGNLRGRLRDMLAGGDAAMARLAAVDAAMERVLSPREHMLLAAVPRLLGEHFERLRERAAQATDSPAFAPGSWLERFRKDRQSVLLAELDVRFQPIEGLLAALRRGPLEAHAQKSS